MKKKYNLSRRDFLNLSALGTAGLVASSLLPDSLLAAKKQGAMSTVIQIKDDDASKVEGATKKYPVNQTVAQKMMDAGIKQLTGIDNIGDAWKSLFPGITKDKKISIKVNCIAAGNVTNGLSSHPEVAFSIVNGLKLMTFDGLNLAEENITIWDRSNRELKSAGYSLNESSKGFKCCGTTNFEYSKEVYKVNNDVQLISNILLLHTDYLINLCVLKDHEFAGVTLSMKNHYGTIQSPQSMHDNNCDPFVGALNNLNEIKSKQVLCICDAIYGIISGGPNSTPQVKPNILLFSKDPVALDTVGGQLLIDQGMSKSKRTMAHYIDTAANPPYNLGTNDLSQIDHVKIDLTSSTPTGVHNHPIDHDNLKIFSNYPNPFRDETFICYQLFRPDNVKIDIFDLKGALVANIINLHQTEGYYQLPWNGKNTNGTTLISGNYIAKYTIGNFSHSIKLIKR